MARKREQLSVNNNYLKMDRCISILIHVRTVIFEAIKKANPGLLPFDWLMVQLYPEKTMKKDLFSFVFEKMLQSSTRKTRVPWRASREIWRKWRERVALVRDGGRRSSGPSEWAHGFFPLRKSYETEDCFLCGAQMSGQYSWSDWNKNGLSTAGQYMDADRAYQGSAPRFDHCETTAYTSCEQAHYLPDGQTSTSIGVVTIL